MAMWACSRRLLRHRCCLGRAVWTSPSAQDRHYHTRLLSSSVGCRTWSGNWREQDSSALHYLLRSVQHVGGQTGRTFSTCSVLAAENTAAAVGEVVSSKPATAAVNSAPESTATPAVTPPVDAVNVSGIETSAHAKWAVDAADVLTELPAQGDLASLGLCANTPVGWLQMVMESIHVYAHLPWWAAIVASTVLLRAVIFPLVMKIQKNGVIMNNINPELQKLMRKQKEYRQMGNKTLADQYSFKIWNVYQKNNCNPLKMAILPLIQVPLFISFFIAIRRMAAVPVESMKTGGALWFQDLTVPDPYYALPILACASFVASIELGGETGVGNPQTAKLKNVFRLMPIILIPITASFPAGLFMYWLPASVISIGQIMLLKVQSVRAFFGIPKVIRHPQEPHEKGKGVMSYFKDSYSSSMAIAEAKQSRVNAEKKYKELRKNPKPKLYDRPPHLMKEQ